MTPGGGAHARSLEEQAFAKVNLVLQVGARRGDGLHEICSLFASVDLADRVSLEVGERDEVLCPGVEGPNLALAALERLRVALGPEREPPPLTVRIEKRVPVAAGLGGGSADAAAVLRGANALAGSPLDAGELRAIAAELGADVPSQVEPAHALVTGAGEHVEALGLGPGWIVLVPQPAGLSTAAVYGEADRLGATRPRLDAGAVRTLAGAPPEVLAAALENDLQAAALSLRPDLARVLEHLVAVGALGAAITGSGPTAFGLFEDREAAERAGVELEASIVAALR